MHFIFILLVTVTCIDEEQYNLDLLCQWIFTSNCEYLSIYNHNHICFDQLLALFFNAFEVYTLQFHCC